MLFKKKEVDVKIYVVFASYSVPNLKKNSNIAYLIITVIPDHTEKFPSIEKDYESEKVSINLLSEITSKKYYLSFRPFLCMLEIVF